MSFFNTKSHKKSFSLPEISVVIAVFAFLTFTSVRSLQNVLNKTQTSVDKQKMKIVKQALQTYFDTHGYLPAPADYTLTNNDANYGKSKTAKSSYDGTLDGDFFYNANDDKGLPDEYQEVEYIESTGTQYIDTGYKPNNMTKITIDMTLISENPNDNWSKPFGVNDGNYVYFMQSNKQGTNSRFANAFSFSCGKNEDPYRAISSIKYTFGNRYVITTSNCSIQVNNSSSSATAYGNFNITKNLTIFANNGIDSQNAYMKLYSFKIIENTSLIHNFVPCYRKSDGVIGLYDKVEGKFYTNQGSGTFLKGNDVNNGTSTNTQTTIDNNSIPSEYKEVEYIESTGTQYINTGVLPNKTTEVEIDFLIPNASYGIADVWPVIFGSRTLNHSSDTLALIIRTNTMLRFAMGPERTYLNDITYEQNQKINVKASYSFFSINGIEYKTNFTTPTDGIYPIYLFTLNHSGDANNYSALTGHKRIYSVKIKNNEQLVRDFIPCYRKSDNVLGLYDKVEGQFYTNQGSGTFLKGNDVNNSKATANVSNMETETEIKNLNHNYTVYRGIVPFREIGLAEEDVVDSKGNFFEYYVPEIMTIPTDTTLATIEDKEFIKNGYAIKKLDSDYPYSKYPCPAKKGDIPSSICTETTSNLFGVEMVKTEIKKETIEYKIVVNNVNNINNVNEKPSIPQEYQEVEYIESTGTQWIDTNYYHNSDTQVDIELSWTVFANSGNWFPAYGSRTDCGTADQLGIWTFGSNYYKGNSVEGQTNITLQLNKKYKYHLQSRNTQLDRVIVDQNTINSYTAHSDIIFALWSQNQGGIWVNNNGYSHIKLYSCIIKDGNVLKRDFIPCYRKSDGVIGLYDKVEGKFYTNQGTGTFLKGNDVNNGTAIQTQQTQQTTESANIPSIYQEVEYIDTNCSYNRNAANSNCPYIDTGVKTTTNGIGIEGKIVVGGTNSDDWQQIFGNRNANGKFGLWWYNEHSGLFWETDQQSSCQIASNNINHTDPFTIKITGNTFNINGYATTCTNTKKNGTTNLLLFDVNDSNESVRPTKVYYWKIYDGTTLVRDFIPCYRKSDNVLGLYDKVEGKFYTNQGSGTFLKGNDVNNGTAIQTQQTQQTTESANIPSEYKEVEYIESTGTQYIATEFIPNNNTKLVLDFYAENYDNNHLFGTTKQTTNTAFEHDTYMSTIWRNSLAIGVSNSYSTVRDLPSSTYPYNTGRHTLIFNDNGEYKLDNLWTFTYQNRSYGTYPLVLFARCNGNSKGKLKLYSCKVYNDNTLKLNFIPCYRKSDGVIGLYDKVEGKFYTNQGSGTFLKGEDVNNNTSTQTITKTIIKIINSTFIQPPYGLRIKNLKTEKDIETNGSVAYLLLSHGEDGEKTCSIKRSTTIGQAPVVVNTLENASKINATNKFEAQNCFNAVKQDTYNLVARNDFLTGTNKEYMFYKGKQNADFDDIVEYGTLAELIKGGAGVNY